MQYKRGRALKAGDKVYTCNRGKGLMLAVIGKASLAEGAADRGGAYRLAAAGSEAHAAV